MVEICNQYNRDSGYDPSVYMKLGYRKLKKSDFINNFWSDISYRYYDKHSNKTIMVLGCSYAEGAGLNRNEKLSYLLSEKLNYNVINAGFGGHGIQSAYKLLKDSSLFNKYNIDYFVYVYISDHLRRLYERDNLLSYEIYPHYEIKNGQLVEENLPDFIFSSYTVNNISNWLMREKQKEEQKNYKLFNVVLSELEKTTKQINPNSKFIILVVPQKYSSEKFALDSMFPPEELSKIEKMNINVINAEDLTNENIREEKWYIEDKCHPSASYWKLIAPKFSKMIKDDKFEHSKSEFANSEI